jgi:hypothetical protein
MSLEVVVVATHVSFPTGGCPRGGGMGYALIVAPQMYTFHPHDARVPRREVEALLREIRRA